MKVRDKKTRHDTRRIPGEAVSVIRRIPKILAVRVVAIWRRMPILSRKAIRDRLQAIAFPVPHGLDLSCKSELDNFPPYFSLIADAGSSWNPSHRKLNRVPEESWYAISQSWL